MALTFHSAVDDITIYISDSKQIPGFSLYGGLAIVTCLSEQVVYLEKAFMDRLTREETEFLIQHEIGHLKLDHLNAFKTLLKVNTDTWKGKFQLFCALVKQNYKKHMIEFEADAYAVANGASAAAGISMLEKLVPDFEADGLMTDAIRKEVDKRKAVLAAS